jgi:4-hydroxybenzoate polyprenyltransferase
MLPVKHNSRDAPFTDLFRDGWIERYVPEPFRAYARLMRLDRPIGAWLLLLPCWWSLALATNLLPNIWLMLLFGLGAVIMRAAGCVINDLYDRKLDRLVERTAARPLASGVVKPWQALLLLLGLLAAGLGILLLFNRATLITGALSLLPVFVYPLMKRVTWWPQLFLGFTFNWGALMGWTAVTGHLSFTAIVLYVAGIFWTLGYDTIYAHQDKRDDETVGIKSTALLLGARSPIWVMGFYAGAVLLLALAGWLQNLDRGFYYGLLAAAAFAFAQLALWRMDDPENCLRRFRANRDFGLIVLAALVLGKLA